MSNTLKLRFSKENIWTVSGFVLDSFDTHQPEFAALLGEATFGAAFAQELTKARAKVKGATAAMPRIGGGVQVTNRLYANLEAVKPLLDKLDIRLGLLPAATLTVPVRGFGLKELRGRINASDAEAVSRGLVTLTALIDANRAAFDTKGYNQQERDELTDLHERIDADNALQNSGANSSQEATKAEDADYKALDDLLRQVLRAGRLLFKKDKVKRQQYTQTVLLQRVKAGEKPRAQGEN